MNHPVATPDRLLDAARQLFSEKGFDAASVREITRAARANLGAITYHFGTKEQLRLAVVDRVARGFAQRIVEALAPPNPAPERLAAMVEALFGFFADYPDAPRLMLHLLAEGGPSPGPLVAQQRRVLEAVATVVRQGVADGELRPVDPFFVAFSIVSQSVWFAIMRSRLAALAGLPDRPELAAAVQRHVAETVTRAFAPVGAAS